MRNSQSLNTLFGPLKKPESCKIAIIGLGYVGLPLGIAFAKKYKVLAYDNNPGRINELLSGNESTMQVDVATMNLLKRSIESNENGICLSADENSLALCNIYIITVPTPVNKFNSPDLGPLLVATAMIGRYLKKGDLVIYESTVYPGCTEEDCIPVLESASGLKCNYDFLVGYSPERVSPGDKEHTLTTITKVISGSNEEATEIVESLYSSIIQAGTYRAQSIKIAEAAKAIENAQRDVNISFMNELAMIFDRIGIDTNDVLEAAGTKWNFLKFKPGLVGGHCIGVDPYYLAHKAESLGYYPQVILSGRRVNEDMGLFVANKLVKLLVGRNHKIAGLRVLILGITFKENCPDIRNTRVIDIYRELTQFGLNVDVYDPWANAKEVRSAFGFNLVTEPVKGYHAVVLAVAHDQFKLMNCRELCEDSSSIIFDTKAILPREMVDCRL